MTRRHFLTLPALAAVTGPGSLLAAAQEKAKPLNLKVTDLKSWIVNHSSGKNYVFCKIYTNQGIVGVGEGSVTSKAATMKAAIDEHHRYLVGRDPTDIEMHWQAMFRWPRWRGGPILNSAISAVEIALWDILGQAVGQPIYKLIGGKARNKGAHVRAIPAAAPRRNSMPERWVAAKNEGLERRQGRLHHHRRRRHRSGALDQRRHPQPQGCARSRGRRLRDLHRRPRQGDADHGLALLPHGRASTRRTSWRRLHRSKISTSSRGCGRRRRFLSLLESAYSLSTASRKSALGTWSTTSSRMSFIAAASWR